MYLNLLCSAIESEITYLEPLPTVTYLNTVN
jgi:hypothetical protein